MTHRASCALNTAEHAAVVAAAARDGRTVSGWLRQLVLASLSDPAPTVPDDG